MAFLPPLAIALPSLLGVASVGLTAVNAISTGKYQAAVLRNNAAIAEQNAAKISEASQREAMRSDQDYRAAVAEMIAQQGASGFDILGRSQTGARMLTTRTGRMAAKDITEEGTAAARRSLQDAADMRGQAKMAVRQGYITAAGAALGAASDIVGSGSLIGRRSKRMPWDRGKPNWYAR